jgi:hypothetical protein
MVNHWQMQLWLVHLTQVWHSELEGCKTVQHAFRKGKGGLQTKIITTQSISWLTEIWSVDKFDHVKLICVVNWRSSKWCHKTFRHFVMLVSWLNSSSTMTWLNPRQSWKISTGKSQEPWRLVSYVSKTQITKSVKIIRLINTSKEETICTWMCVVRDFNIQPEYSTC